ncbi:hypothetical protein TWF481_002259 [Arthrobotrys musiformis]|uniref:Uncharacterized protein n=1 Tax=Arthrobotrys musiformis TaxID=47236 RepID=A0AAV9VSQ1_9PEZI
MLQMDRSDGPQSTPPLSMIPSPTNSDYSVDSQAAPRGVSLRERLEWARANPSSTKKESQKKRKRSSSPVAPRPRPLQPSPERRMYREPQHEELSERQSPPEISVWPRFSDAMYAPLRAGQETGGDSGRTTPHMLRIPPEEPQQVHQAEDDDSPVRGRQRSSPNWTVPESLDEGDEEERPAPPPPSTTYVDGPALLPQKRRWQSVEEVVEDGEGMPNPNPQVAGVRRPSHSLPAVIVHDDPSPRPRKKRCGGTLEAPSECYSLPTPIFHPSPAREREEKERGEKERGEKERGEKDEEDDTRRLTIAQPIPHPARPRTYGEIRSGCSTIVQPSSHQGPVPGNPAIVQSDAQPQQEGGTGEREGGSGQPPHLSSRIRLVRIRGHPAGGPRAQRRDEYHYVEDRTLIVVI